MKNNIKSNFTSILKEKNSKFIANLFIIESKEDALKIINNIKNEYKDATHNVYAYIVMEENNIISKCSDDREPKGTAGRPILFLLSENNLSNVLITVTRYFGGTLLGKGGLRRAYTKVTKMVLEKNK